MKDKCCYTRPWYDFSEKWLELKEQDFVLSKIEKEWVINIYLELIDLDKNIFNYENMKKKWNKVDFLEFDYSNEMRMEEFVKNFLNEAEYFYSIPIVFDRNEYMDIVCGFKPSLISKTISNYSNYDRVFGSMVSDYSGKHFIIANNLKFLYIVCNGHFVLRFYNEQFILKDNWSKLLDNDLEIYDYDKEFLINFYEYWKY
ncbi:hypothetical protein [Rodentibacter sp. Ppn85]|uniref:hypothetical protein n=1 Tax=Rodentibacter sp. Ppn85 TaxID=1908525 RepID=UPI000984D1B7|nr:hypothetical protein [Rodentibacter sp. Ppn85]OOF63186.1 hypothetical protein BKL51_08850 [Rodentibacter sp. Ppn85]